MKEEQELEKDQFRSIKNDLYRRYRDGFYIFAPKFKSVQGLLSYICTYLSHPFMAESRILDYDGEFVTFWYQRHTDNLIVIEKLHVYKLIQRLIMHIPEPNFKPIRFYVAYHNRTKISIDVAHLIDQDRINFKKSLNK